MAVKQVGKILNITLKKFDNCIGWDGIVNDMHELSIFDFTTSSSIKLFYSSNQTIVTLVGEPRAKSSVM